MSIAQFDYSAVPETAELLRQEVRAFLATAMAHYTPAQRAQSWMGFDADFSRGLARQGWIGMALPRRYGGGDADLFSRYVVIEELLAEGAPVAAHWMADRQSAPLLMRYGTEAQRQRFLPAICAGESYFCIGMSEPNSGSDLAAVGTRARRAGDEWVLNGRKLWSTNAHRCHYMIALVRTGETSGARHEGLSQVIIDLKLPGVTIRPIRDMTGDAHFNEIFFDDVVLADDALIGQEGNGWQQVMAELAIERSGPERYLSSMALVNAMLERVGTEPDALQTGEIGRLLARLYTLRNMSVAVTASLQAGRDPAWAASCVKDLGTSLEQDIPRVARRICDAQAYSQGGDSYSEVLARIIQMAPSFSLRGGTREILRGIIARGLGAA
ncbi:MAG: acyl-CoA dehydrogenase family protein [Gammaproteobacteria bacterium]|nr:acyl-CoA dehydrogenase family protein [Gammaproteobacteria bacterium]